MNKIIEYLMFLPLLLISICIVAATFIIAFDYINKEESSIQCTETLPDSNIEVYCDNV